MSLRVFSHGGGVQSTAALVLSAQGVVSFPVHLFANVGDDSEASETLDYVRDVSVPFAKAHGIDLVEVRYTKPDGSQPTLLETMTNEGGKEILIPVRVAPVFAPGHRGCTKQFKVGVIHKWLRIQGASKKDPATVGIGFSIDEIHRAGKGKMWAAEVIEYPLLDLKMRRSDCLHVIAQAGLPEPPKSACWFCPMRPQRDWAIMRRDDPKRFAASVQLERGLNERRAGTGKNRVTLGISGRPLDEAIHEAQPSLFDQDGWGQTCDEGVCFT
jgi:hypothetical protein